jgi:hypothetical protein
VFVMELPGCSNHFSVHRHSAARRMFGRGDVETGHPEFERHFTLQGQDPQAAAHALRGPWRTSYWPTSAARTARHWFLGDRLVCAYESRFARRTWSPRWNT